MGMGHQNILTRHTLLYTRTNMKGHGRMYVVPMGQEGALLCESSTKIMINTLLSSTETEMSSVGEKLSKHLWFRYFVISK